MDVRLRELYLLFRGYEVSKTLPIKDHGKYASYCTYKLESLTKEDIDTKSKKCF